MTDTHANHILSSLNERRRDNPRLQPNLTIPLSRKTSPTRKYRQDAFGRRARDGRRPHHRTIDICDVLTDLARTQLIHHTIANFNIQPDKQAIARINDSYSTLQQAREMRLRDAENALKSTLLSSQCIAIRRSKVTRLLLQPSMAYLWETPETTQHHQRQLPLPPPPAFLWRDRATIPRISHFSLNLKTLFQDADQTQTELSRQLNTMSSQHAELTQAHSSTAHASEIARLDTAKFRTAKAASDAEMEAERLAQQAADLNARLQELEIQGLDGSADDQQRRRDPVDDEVLLRLKVYRSLGIEIERDTKDGEFSRAVVRNDRKGDVHVVNLDPKFSKFFYANYFWQTL